LQGTVRGVGLAKPEPTAHAPPMPTFEHRFEVDAPIEAVRAFHSSPEALKILTPPGSVIQLRRFGPLEDGMEAEFRLWLGPIPIDWLARHEDVTPDGFVDVQVQGPLSRWRHRHAYRALGPDRSEVIDRIEYAHPPGLRGLGTRLLFGRAALAVLFAHRARATRRATRASRAS
jgi:ligand-binding SRPBCC domain-containing protein